MDGMSVLISSLDSHVSQDYTVCSSTINLVSITAAAVSLLLYTVCSLLPQHTQQGPNYKPHAKLMLSCDR